MRCIYGEKTAKSFRDLIVWQKAHNLALSIYSLTESFPKTEMYGLTSQIRRSVVSVPANIAEGFKKKTYNEKARFLNIAQGSLEETRYYLILSTDLGYGNCTNIETILDEVGRMLDAYLKSIQKHTD